MRGVRRTGKSPLRMIGICRKARRKSRRLTSSPCIPLKACIYSDIALHQLSWMHVTVMTRARNRGPTLTARSAVCVRTDQQSLHVQRLPISSSTTLQIRPPTSPHRTITLSRAIVVVARRKRAARMLKSHSFQKPSDSEQVVSSGKIILTRNERILSASWLAYRTLWVQKERSCPESNRGCRKILK